MGHRGVPRGQIRQRLERHRLIYENSSLDDRSIRSYGSVMMRVVAPVERELPSLTHLQGALIVFGTGVIFSFGGLAFRSVEDIGPWEYLFFRGVGMLGAAAAVLAVRYRGRYWVLLNGVENGHLIAGAVLGMMNTLFIVSLSVASVAFVLILQTLAPLAAAYFSWLLMGERPSPSVLFATALSMVGVAVMVGGSIRDDLSPWGLLAALIPLGFGYYSTLIRSARRIDPSVPVIVAGLTLVAVGIGVVTAQGGFEATSEEAAIGLFAGSLLLAAPLALFNVAQRVVPAPESAILIMGEIVLAPLWVWIFVGEKASASTVFGGAIILAAVVWVTLTHVPRKGRRPITSRG
jgi:DME family drug/metabolite transporter